MVEGNLEKNLSEIDLVLKKYLQKIIIKFNKAEIRNISELVRKKNLNAIVPPNKSVRHNSPEKKSCFRKCISNDIDDALPLKLHYGFYDEIFTFKNNFIFEKVKRCTKRIALKNIYVKNVVIFYDFLKWQEHKGKYKKEFLLSEGLIKNILTTECRNLEVLSETLGVISKNLLIEYTPKEKLANSAQKHDLKNCTPAKTEKEYICACGKVFQILKSFRKHKRLKHSVSIIKHSSVICGKYFLEKEKKRNIQVSSHKEKRYSYLTCPKEFSKSNILKRTHIVFSLYSEGVSLQLLPKNFKLK